MYGKLFASAYEGSLIGSGPVVFSVWGYIIAKAVKSRVEVNPKLLSVIIGCPVKDIQNALDFLCSPDGESRTKDYEGKRLIKEGEFQYFVVNHEKYKRLRNEDERREYNRKKQAEYRAKKHLVNDKSTRQQMSAVCTHTEADTEAYTESVLVDNIINDENIPLNSNNVNGDDVCLEFEEFRKLYPGNKRGYGVEFDNFKKKHKQWKSIVPLLKPAIEAQIQERKLRKSAKLFCPNWKNLQTWINQSCWTEEHSVIENETGTEASNSLIDRVARDMELQDQIDGLLKGK